MRFRFVSQQLTVQEGDIAVARDQVSLDALKPLAEPRRITADYSEEFPGVGPGDVKVALINCLVRSRTTGVAQRIPIFFLKTRITEADLARGIADVPCAFHAFVRIAAVDVHGEALSRKHLLGVALEWVSIEVEGPEQAPLHVLLPPGEYLAYFTDGGSGRVLFRVGDSEEDAGTVRVSEATGLSRCP